MIIHPVILQAASTTTCAHKPAAPPSNLSTIITSHHITTTTSFPPDPHNLSHAGLFLSPLLLILDLRHIHIRRQTLLQFVRLVRILQHQRIQESVTSDLEFVLLLAVAVGGAGDGLSGGFLYACS